MKIYVNGVEGIDVESQITDCELMVIMNAYRRGFLKEAKVAVTFQGGTRYLDVAAIDAARTLPDVVFDNDTVRPPPPPGLANTSPPASP